MTSQVEYREFRFEHRESGDGRTVEGIAVPFNVISGDTPHGDERFMRGAFKRTLNNQRNKLPKLYRSHDPSKPIGTATQMTETDQGLMVAFRLADTDAGNSALQEVREGMLDSFSVGFSALREAIVQGVREVREARLHEVSLVAMPAYAGAQVMSLRNADHPRIVLPPMPEISDASVIINGVRWG